MKDEEVKVLKGALFRVTAQMRLPAFLKLTEISRETRLPKTKVIEGLILEFGDEFKRKAIEELKDIKKCNTRRGRT